MLTSDKTRSQIKNIEDCVDKLYEIILKAAEIPKAPDEETLKRIEQLYVQILVWFKDFLLDLLLILSNYDRVERRRKIIEEEWKNSIDPKENPLVALKILINNGWDWM